MRNSHPMDSTMRIKDESESPFAFPDSMSRILLPVIPTISPNCSWVSAARRRYSRIFLESNLQNSASSIGYPLIGNIFPTSLYRKYISYQGAFQLARSLVGVNCCIRDRWNTGTGLVFTFSLWNHKLLREHQPRPRVPAAKAHHRALRPSSAALVAQPEPLLRRRILPRCVRRLLGLAVLLRIPRAPDALGGTPCA